MMFSTGESFGYTPGDDAARNRPVDLNERLEAGLIYEDIWII